MNRLVVISIILLAVNTNAQDTLQYRDYSMNYMHGNKLFTGVVKQDKGVFLQGCSYGSQVFHVKANVKQGSFIGYYKNGRKGIAGQYEQDMEQGAWKQFDFRGNVTREVTWEYGAITDHGLCGCKGGIQQVCGTDGRIYFNKCYAECKGVKVRAEGACKGKPDPADYLTWPVIRVCDAMGKRYQKLFSFFDGTLLYFDVMNKDTVRGTQNRCKCLPGDALIATPGGEIPVRMLQEGDTIFTFIDKDAVLQLTAVPVLETGKASVEDDHVVIQLTLKDGRKVVASPGHPVGGSGRPFSDFKKGDQLDGSVVIKRVKLDYTEHFTYDIRTSGLRGGYVANGVWLGTTLSPDRLTVARSLR